MKKVSKIFLSLVLFFMSSILFDGCSCTSGYDVKVNFIEVPEELSCESYVKEVEFEGSHKIEFEIPEGFEESGLKVLVGDKEIEFDVEYVDGEDVEVDYLYSVKKKISFSVDGVKRNIDVNIDMSNLQKKTFELSFASDITDLEAVVIDPDSVGRLMALNSDNTVRKVKFIDNKVQVSYGEYVALVYTQSSSNRSFSKLYTNRYYFSDENKIKMINNTEYLEYPVAMRGNTYYRYDGGLSSKIYYFGQVKEDVQFLFSPPNYVGDNKLRVGNGYNTFYLLSNMQKYNSDLISIETFVENSKASYSVNNKDVDRIGTTILSKITPTADYNEQYDVSRIYLGDNLVTDPLLQEDERKGMYPAIYYKISSELDINNLDCRLLINECMFNVQYTKLNNFLLSDKDNYYIKISKDELIKYYDKYQEETITGSTIEYYNGSAFLYVGIDQSYRSEAKKYGTFEYSMISLFRNVAESSSGGSVKTLKLIPYVYDSNGNKDYGYIDYHTFSDLDIMYIRTDKLFDENNMYKNNIYLDLFGETYKNYTTTRLSTVNFIFGVSEYLTKIPLNVTDPTVYNGYEGYNVQDLTGRIIKKDNLDQYSLKAEVTFVDIEKNNYKVDFSNLELPKQIGEGIYVTNNYNVSAMTDFTLVNYINKTLFDGVDFGYSKELYYIATSNYIENMNINVFLDSDGNKLVSYDAILYDITGKEVVVNRNGEPFVVRYKYMLLSYEKPDDNKFHMCSYEE